jgi:hypothetical protein
MKNLKDFSETTPPTLEACQIRHLTRNRGLTKDRNGPSFEHTGLPLGNDAFYQVYSDSILSNIWAFRLVGTQRCFSYKSSPFQRCPKGAPSGPYCNRALFQYQLQACPILQSVLSSDALFSSSGDDLASDETAFEWIAPALTLRNGVGDQGSTPRYIIIGGRL